MLTLKFILAIYSQCKGKSPESCLNSAIGIYLSFCIGSAGTSPHDFSYKQNQKIALGVLYHCQTKCSIYHNSSGITAMSKIA